MEYWETVDAPCAKRIRRLTSSRRDSGRSNLEDRLEENLDSGAFALYMSEIDSFDIHSCFNNDRYG